MRQNHLKGNLMLLLAAIIWGTSFIAQSKGVELISAACFNGVRSVLGGVVLLPLIAIQGFSRRKLGMKVEKINKTLIISGILCGICLCLASTVQTWGMVYTSPGKSGFITALYMVFIPIVKLFMGEKPRPAVAAAVLIAVAGLYLLCIDSELSINKGDVLTLICSLLFTGHILLIDFYSPRVDGVKLACMQFFVCGFLDLIYVFLFEQPKIEPILNCWSAICYSGILSCGVAYTLQIVGQKYTDPTSASILMSLESVFSTIATVVLVQCGWTLTGGTLSLKEITGCVLMFAAITLVQLSDAKKDASAKKRTLSPE